MSSKSKAVFWKEFLPLALAAVVVVVAFVAGRGLLDASSAPVLGDEEVDVDGMAFPTAIKVAGARQSLIGGGTRSKWGVRVYALGIYSDPKLTRSLKKKYPDESIAGDATAASKFYAAKKAKTLLLRFHRGVASSDMSEALGEALVDKIGEEKSNAFSKFVLDIVGSDRLEKGSDIFITCNGEKLWASLTEGGRRDADTIEMKGLCPAIFMAYLGSSPVSAHIKEGFEKEYAALEV